MIVSDMEKISSFQKIHCDTEENSDTESEYIQCDIVVEFVYDMWKIYGGKSKYYGKYHRNEFPFFCEKHRNCSSYHGS